MTLDLVTFRIKNVQKKKKKFCFRILLKSFFLKPHFICTVMGHGNEKGFDRRILHFAQVIIVFLGFFFFQAYLKMHKKSLLFENFSHTSKMVVWQWRHREWNILWFYIILFYLIIFKYTIIYIIYLNIVISPNTYKIYFFSVFYSCLWYMKQR